MCMVLDFEKMVKCQMFSRFFNSLPDEVFGKKMRICKMHPYLDSCYGFFLWSSFIIGGSVTLSYKIMIFQQI